MSLLNSVGYIKEDGTEEFSSLDMTPAGTTDTLYMNVVGCAIEQIAVSSSGYAWIMPVPAVVGNSA